MQRGADVDVEVESVLPFPMETTYTWSDVPGGTLMRLRNRGTPPGSRRGPDRD